MCTVCPETMHIEFKLVYVIVSGGVCTTVTQKLLNVLLPVETDTVLILIKWSA